jgi:predicted dehydrogenase
MKDIITIGLAGCGNRGLSLLSACILPRRDVRVAAVCDVYQDRQEAAAERVEKAGQSRPRMTADYRDILAMPEIDGVIIASGWAPHVDIACAAMRAGKYSACEVAGAYSLDDCWRLVHTYEETGTPCMLLENCCYGRYELMVLNMVRQGLFGEIVHCAGGYHHDLRRPLSASPENRHYRLDDYLYRNCENYPTHELGPIARILDINRGNRMLRLNSAASKAAGLSEFIRSRNKSGNGEAPPKITQGDIITTIITCARGETIVLTLDTTLPRAYSRGFEVRGTRGMFFEDNRSVFLDGEHGGFEFNGRGLWGNADQYFEHYEHPVWKAYLDEGIKGGHDGMDWLEFTAFFDAVRQSGPVPIDVYDMAAWMSITCLSEDSIAVGGAPVAIPDFTNGKWMSARAGEGFPTH